MSGRDPRNSLGVLVSGAPVSTCSSAWCFLPAIAADCHRVAARVRLRLSSATVVDRAGLVTPDPLLKLEMDVPMKMLAEAECHT
jgi:hypothetical protein